MVRNPPHTASLSLLLLLAFALAGCTSDGGGSETDDETGPDSNGGEDPDPTGEPTASPTASPTTGTTPPDPPEDEEPQPGAVQEESGSLVFQGESCLASRAYVAAGTIPLSTPMDGVTRIVFAVDPDTIGQPYKVSWTFDTGYIEATTFFAAADGSIVSHRVVEGPDFGDITMQGTVPEGAEYAVLYGCGGPASADVHYISEP